MKLIKTIQYYKNIFSQFIRADQLNRKMAENNVIKKLEARATLAENLISVLKKEISEVSSMVSAVQNSKRIDLLKAESEILEKKVLQSKEELIELQKKNGVEQIPLPDDDKIIASAGEKKTLNRKERETNNKNETVTKEAKSKTNKTESDNKKVKKEINIGRINLRVGRILHIQDHPEAENLYIETIDVGEKEPRQIISGLRKHIMKEELLLRPVICVCNLKTAKLRGEKSYGMLLCAVNNKTVEPLWPPQNAEPGEILTVGSIQFDPDDELDPKEKVFETVVKDLSVNDNNTLMLKDVFPVEIKHKGVVHTKMLKNCKVG